MEQNYFIGVDIGTTSTKAVVFTSSGAVKGIGNREYPILVPKPTLAEQDPEAIFAAMISATRDAIEHRTQLASPTPLPGTGEGRLNVGSPSPAKGRRG